MRVVVTGAGGFVGRRLVAMLDEHDVVAVDNKASTIPDLVNVNQVVGDLCDAGVIEEAFSGGCDAVVHLATVPGGAAEENPELARQVNVDATMAVSAKAAGTGNRPRFVFASSIAVFGDSLPARVDDSTPLAPTMLYGAHKVMMEQWLATLTRRGELDAISLRLSGVVARPRGPSGMKSAFLSDMFHALRAGEGFVVPVSSAATCWLTSVDCAADNFVHALVTCLDSTPENRAINLPALQVRISDLAAAIVDGADGHSAAVSYESDAQLEAAFGSYPPLLTPIADTLGFVNDGDVQLLVDKALARTADSRLQRTVMEAN